MHKLIKYLKPFWVSLLLVVGLLYAQAQCELALPDYMSRIVDDGIQNGGVEDAALVEMRQETYDHLMFFLSEEEKNFISENYTFNEESKSYTRNSVNQETQKKMSGILEKPLVLVSALTNPEMSGPILAQMQLTTSTDVFGALSDNPELVGQLEGAMSSMGLSDSVLSMAARQSVKTEYELLGKDTGAIQINYILMAGFKMLGIALLGATCAIAVGFLASRIAGGLSRNLRGLVFSKVESFSSTEFNHFSTASLITRTTNDIQQVQQITVMLLRIVVYAPIMGVGAIIKVMNSNSKMLWIIGLVIGIIMVLLLATFALTMPKFKKIQKLTDQLNLVTREFLSGMPVIRAFNTQKHEEERFDGVNRSVKKVNLFVNRTMACVMPIMNFILSAVSILIVWVGAQYIDMGTLQVGDMMAFMQYSMQIIMSFVMISMIAIMIPQASVSALRIVEVLDMPLSIEDKKEGKKFEQRGKGEVVFDHVSFKYPGAEVNVLEDISFTAHAGKTTAFIGSTGSGKSTLINLVPRFFDVSEGRILIDGLDVREVSQHDLREKMGYVPQKGVLFSGDIESNLRYAKEDASEEELELALTVSQAKEFVEAKPEKMKSAIAQGGTNVSGGQKQRLSIARALVKNPEIYIFDDSFSALDFKTDAALREALNQQIEKTKNTVLLVAQRISTIMHADQIIVLDQGKIAGIGTHDELMENCEVYQEIAYSQLSKEELNHD